MVSFVGFWLASICLETAAILREDESEASLASRQTATQYDFKEYCFRL